MGRPLLNDLIGKKSGILTIVEFSHIDRSKKLATTYWKCRCECGVFTIVERSNLTRKGNRGTKSCGCIDVENCRKKFLGNTFRRKAPGETGFNMLIGTYKRSARDRDLPFDTSNEFKLELKKITKSNCFYCGIEPKQIIKPQEKYHPTKESIENSTYIYNGIDRIDSNKGYEFGNVVPCCYHCNLAKSDYTTEEFMEWANRLAKHMESKNE